MKKAGVLCLALRLTSDITLESLGPNHKSEHLLIIAKVTLVERKLLVTRLTDQLAPLGAAVEIAPTRRRGYRARSTRPGDGGRAVEV